MAMRIEYEGAGYRIRLSGDRTRIVARTVQEVTVAVLHYYQADHGGNPQHTACPICRVIAAKGE